MAVATEEEPASLAEMAAQEAAEAEAAKKAAGETETETDTETAAETETKTGEEDELSETPILDYYRELHPDDRSIDRFTSDDDFLGSYKSAQSLIGQREDAAEIKRYLEQEGVTPRELAEWLQARKQVPAKDGDPVRDPTFFDPDWIAEDAQGNWVPSADSPLTQAEWEVRARRYQKQMRDYIKNPAKMAKEMLKYLQPEIAKATAEAKTEMARGQAARDDAAAESAFIDRHAAVLYKNGKAEDGFAPIASRVTAIAKSLDKSAYPTHEARLEQALKWAALETTPQLSGAKLPSAAKHAVAPAAPAKSKAMNIDEFEEAWPDAKLSEISAAFPDGVDGKFSGKVPSRPRAKKK